MSQSPLRQANKQLNARRDGPESSPGTRAKTHQGDAIHVIGARERRKTASPWGADGEGGRREGGGRGVLNDEAPRRPQEGLNESSIQAFWHPTPSGDLLLLLLSGKTAFALAACQPPCSFLPPSPSAIVSRRFRKQCREQLEKITRENYIITGRRIQSLGGIFPHALPCNVATASAQRAKDGGD